MSTKSFSELLKENGKRPVDVARALGVEKSTVSRWCSGQVPADKVIAVEDATGISRFDLRPDLAAMFGQAPQTESAA